MRYILPVLFSSLVLAACDDVPSDVSPEEQAIIEEDIALADAAFAASFETNVVGVPFRVAVVTEKSYALVEPFNRREAYTPEDVESAARNVTQCAPRFDGTRLGDVEGNIRDLDLRGATKTSPERGWRVNLRC